MNSNEKILKFKTNINCGACVAKVTPFLNDAVGIENWEVDTTNREKILSVHANGISEETVIAKVKEAGYKIELLPQ